MKAFVHIVFCLEYITNCHFVYNLSFLLQFHDKKHEHMPSLHYMKISLLAKIFSLHFMSIKVQFKDITQRTISCNSV